MSKNKSFPEKDISTNNSSNKLNSFQESFFNKISELKKFLPLENNYLSKLLDLKIPIDNPIWDLAFYLTYYDIQNMSDPYCEKKQNISEQLIETWKLVEKSRSVQTNPDFTIEKFWLRYISNEEVFSKFKLLFEFLIDNEHLYGFEEFSKIISSFVSSSLPHMNKQQFKTLLAIIEFQTESNDALHKKTGRSVQSISRDKKYLYDNKLLTKSLWIHFNRLNLHQVDVLIIYNALSSNLTQLKNCPWLFSYYQSTIIQNYQFFSFLLPRNLEAQKKFETFIEHILNTTDASEVIIIKPDFNNKSLFVSYNYSLYDPEKSKWNVPIGFPFLYAKAKSPSKKAKILKSEIPKESQEKITFTKEELKALSFFYSKGLLSIRELSNQMKISFHKSRKIIEKLTNSEIYKERFSSRLGSTLSNIYLIAVADGEIIQKIKVFGTFFPEQYLSYIEIEKYSVQKNKWKKLKGIQSYLRTVPHYLEETILTINELANKDKILALPLLGAKRTNWNIPYTRWNEQTQDWEIKNEDFIIPTL